MNIALIGKTGSGKSTLAEYLASEFGLTIINSDIWRDYVKAKVDGYEDLQDALATGKHASNEIEAKALQLKLESTTNKNGCIVDNLFSLKLLQTFEKKQKLDRVFLLDITDEISNARIMQRARKESIPLQQWLENRKTAFEINFPMLECVLGERIIRIDATKDVITIRRQVMKEMGINNSKNERDKI